MPTEQGKADQEIQNYQMRVPQNKVDALLVDITSKLRISLFEYLADRISETGNILPLATIIDEQSSLNPLGLSW